MAREDPVAQRAAMEREAHVRAAIVNGIDPSTVREETECVPVDVNDEPPRRTQLRERRGADERSGGDGSHLLLLHKVYAYRLEPQVRFKSSDAQ